MIDDMVEGMINVLVPLGKKKQDFDKVSFTNTSKEYFRMRLAKRVHEEYGEAAENLLEGTNEEDKQKLQKIFLEEIDSYTKKLLTALDGEVPDEERLTEVQSIILEKTRNVV